MLHAWNQITRERNIARSRNGRGEHARHAGGMTAPSKIRRASTTAREIERKRGREGERENDRDPRLCLHDVGTLESVRAPVAAWLFFKTSGPPLVAQRRARRRSLPKLLDGPMSLRESPRLFEVFETALERGLRGRSGGQGAGATVARGLRCAPAGCGARPSWLDLSTSALLHPASAAAAAAVARHVRRWAPKTAPRGPQEVCTSGPWVGT